MAESTDETPILETRESQERSGSAGNTPPPSLDERLAVAKVRHERLRKQRLLEQLEAEIEEMENFVEDPSELRLHNERATPASSLQNDDDGSSTADIQPEKLNLYNGRNVREHREWTRSAENAFRLALRKFRHDFAKIAWSAQFLRYTPATTWQNIAATGEADQYTWEQYKKILLDLIEDPANRQLEAA
jgi:hypothetical protein